MKRQLLPVRVTQAPIFNSTLHNNSTKISESISNTVLFDQGLLNNTVKGWGKPWDEPTGGRIKRTGSVSNGSTQMHIESIGSNQTELTFNKGQVLFSYKTPVAAYTPSMGYIKTATKWSRTTTRHINKWLEGVTATEVDQDVLDNLVEG